MTIKRDFKGIWIPKNIWFAEDLGWSEKVLLVEIDSLNGEQGCFASNDYLGEFFNLSKDRISRMISSLKNKGYITVELQYRQGTKQIEKRVIRVTAKYNCPIGENTNTYRRKQREGIGENTNPPIGENTKDNNTFINNTINNNDEIDVIRFFQENVRFSLNPIEIETLQYLEQEYPKELIIEAIKRTALNNVTSLRYTEKILKEWGKHRFTTLKEVHRFEEGNQLKKGGKYNANNQSSGRQQRDFESTFGHKLDF